jgi:hypothetical protein
VAKEIAQTGLEAISAFHQSNAENSILPLGNDNTLTYLHPSETVELLTPSPT